MAREGKNEKNNLYRYKEILIISLAIFTIEIGGSILSGSLALFSDAWHVFCDKVAIVLTIIAEYVAEKYKYGKFKERVQRWVFLVNSWLLVFVAFEIFREALLRIYYPKKIATSVFIVVAAVGAIGNFLQRLILQKMAGGLNEVRRVLSFHILSDLWQSLAIVFSSIIIALTGFTIIDSIISIIISIIIFSWGMKLLSKFFRL